MPSFVKVMLAFPQRRTIRSFADTSRLLPVGLDVNLTGNVGKRHPALVNQASQDNWATRIAFFEHQHRASADMYPVQIDGRARRQRRGSRLFAVGHQRNRAILRKADEGANDNTVHAHGAFCAFAAVDPRRQQSSQLVVSRWVDSVDRRSTRVTVVLSFEQSSTLSSRYRSTR